MFYAVIMAGGQGTRLWPLSRKKVPKQLQPLFGKRTLIQETIDRTLPLVPPKRILISTTPEYSEQIQEQIPKIPPENYIIEPFAMGNAAACGLVSMVLRRRDPKSAAIFLPADHSITKVKEYRNILRFADRIIRRHPKEIITIGIEPQKPDTGLGYIQMGDIVVAETADELKAFQVKRFVEKPTPEKAKEYVDSWQYLWNSGMFLWHNDHILSLFEHHMPETFKRLKKIVEAWDKPEAKDVLEREYGKVENTSIDYGIMEKTKDILVIPGSFGWSDVGSWGTLFELLSEIHAKPVVSRGHHVGCDDNNCLVMAGEKLIATVGLEDIVVIDTEDAVLVCNRHKAHKVKDLLNTLKASGKKEYL